MILFGQEFNSSFVLTVLWCYLPSIPKITYLNVNVPSPLSLLICSVNKCSSIMAYLPVGINTYISKSYLQSCVCVSRSLVLCGLAAYYESGLCTHSQVRCLDALGATGVSGLAWAKRLPQVSIDSWLDSCLMLLFYVLCERVGWNAIGSSFFGCSCWRYPQWVISFCCIHYNTYVSFFLCDVRFFFYFSLVIYSVFCVCILC